MMFYTSPKYIQCASQANSIARCSGIHGDYFVSQSGVLFVSMAQSVGTATFFNCNQPKPKGGSHDYI